MSAVEVLVALAIAVGLAGILVPVLPGSILVLGAILFWAWQVGGGTAWTVFAVAAVILVAGGVVKYLVPGRRLKDAGIPASTQWVGAALAIVGFFVVPVVGLPLGFVLAVYLVELHRLHDRGRAWRATVVALQATGITILIELAGALIASGSWLVAVLLT